MTFKYLIIALISARNYYLSYYVHQCLPRRCPVMDELAQSHYMQLCFGRNFLRHAAFTIVVTPLPMFPEPDSFRSRDLIIDLHAQASREREEIALCRWW